MNKLSVAVIENPAFAFHCPHCKEQIMLYSKQIAEPAIPTNGALSLETLRYVTAKYFQVPVAKLMDRSRRRRYLEPRQIFCYLSRRYTKESLKAIGEAIGRDHTSVIHSLRTLKDLIDTQHPIKDDIAQLKLLIDDMVRETKAA